jgi:hypothetical protein
MGVKVMRRVMTILAVLAVFGTTSAIALPTPVLEFHFENDAGFGEDYTAGGTVFDYSSSANNGTLSDPAPTWTTGIAGGGLEFTGGQSIAVAHDESLNPGSGDFALALWILTVDNVDGDVLRKGSSANSSTWYKVEHSPSTHNNRLSLNFNTDGNDATIHSTASYTDEQWHFVVAQRNGDTAELWIDGVLDGTDAISGSISNTGNLGIGSKDTLDDDFLNGTLDEIFIFNSALTPEEIAEMHTTIPEPATIALLGLGSLVFARKRK